MANKLFELFESWFGSSLGKTFSKKPIDSISNASKNLDTITESMDELNDILLEQKDALKDLIKTHGTYSDEVKNVKKDIKQTERELKQENDKRASVLKSLSTETGLSSDEIEDLISQMKLYGKEAAASKLSTSKFNSTLSGLSSALGFNLKELSSEFLTLNSILIAATRQMIQANNYLVEFGRRSGGVLNYNQLGFSPFGANKTGNVGSLSSLTSTNNISEDQFFQAVQGFNQGKVIGQDYSKAAGDIQKFAVQQAQLIKLYGVSSGDVEKITKVTTQLYGTSIKDLNKQFESGAKIAKSAGLNVQQYFTNLARLTDMIGETYIRGGTEGLQKLALFATKMNASADSLVKFGQGFENIGDIYEKQAMATALGLRHFAANTTRMFAQYQLGLQEQLSKTAISNLAKDILKYTDQEGQIDTRGLRALKQIGLDQEQIKLIQRTIQAQKKLGLSFEELTNISELSKDKQIAYYAELNRTASVTEKLNKLWGYFKATILDPIVSILGPLLDITINSLIGLFQGLYIVLKPVISGFQIIGGYMSKVADKIAGVTGYIEEKLKKLGLMGDKAAEGLTSIWNIAGTLVAALITFRAATYAAAAAQRFSGNVGNILGNLGGGKLGKLGSVGRLARMKGGKLLGGLAGKVPSLLKGGGIGILGGLVGDAISSGSEEGSAQDRAGMAISGASTGAAIGSIIPGIGTLVGGIIGAAGGAFWPEIKKGIWSVVDWTEGIFSNTKDTSDSLKESKRDQYQARNIRLAQQMARSEDVFKRVNDMLNSRVVESFAAEKAQEKILRERVSKPEIKITTGLLGGAKVKVSGM